MANTIVASDMLNKANTYPVGLKYNVLAGAAADTNIAVTGITAADKIIFCIHLDVVTFLMADLTAEVVVLSAGNIQLTTTATTSDTLLLCWWDVA